MTSLFGTDGVRGIANRDLTADLAFRLACAGAHVLNHRQDRPWVLVGKDTRLSCDMLEAALCAGFLSQGLHVVRLGVIPTPGVAWLTRHTPEAACGVMISASHNPAEYNGIKFFSHDGYKLPDQVEETIESRMNEKPVHEAEYGLEPGTYIHEPMVERYSNHLASTVPQKLAGLSVSMDTANGAASEMAPFLFAALGARVQAIHNKPDGRNINHRCGSTHVEDLQHHVVEKGTHMGFAFDGDADRLIAVDENGSIVDGDRLMAMLALNLKEQGKLPQNTLVTTVMSNLGLELAMNQAGCQLIRTQVGDRYVLEEMRKNQLILGGEQSGHIIMSDYNTTGDGILTALQVAALVRQSGKPLSQLAGVMKTCPQVLINAQVHNHLKNAYTKDPEIVREIRSMENKMAGRGRVLIRPSGTEALVRVMLEGNDQEELTDMATELARLIEQRLGC